MSSTAPEAHAQSDIAPDVSALVTEDDTPVDNLFSEKQQRLLTGPLYASWGGPPPDESGARRTFLATANVGLFDTPKRPPLVPDAMVSLDVQAPDELWEKNHRSYFVWEYGKPPEVVIEVVSNREGDELGLKRRRYATMRVWHYVVWDPELQISSKALQVFELRGQFYGPMPRAFFPDLGLGLTVWKGRFEGVEAEWLRWCDADGNVLPTGEELARSERERADNERTRADNERTRADSERTRAERLAAKLRALGIDPDAP